MESSNMPADPEFDSGFWREDYRVSTDQIPGPISVASLTQENHYVPHDVVKLSKNVDETIDYFVTLFAQI